jgi:hypothetical protein
VCAQRGVDYERNDEWRQAKMIYIKSTLVGLLTFLVATIVYLVCLISILMRRYPPPPGGEMGFDLSILVSRLSFWFIALAAFAVGFYSEFRRLQADRRDTC